MSDHDAIRVEAERRLKRQADLTAYAARRFSVAVRQGDLDAARRWRREYQMSAACCRALGRQARGEPTAAAGLGSAAAVSSIPARPRPARR